MKKNNTFAVIMAGGKGERFWPLSTSKTPKQLLSIFTGRPMILEAVLRLKGLVPNENIFIITGQSLVRKIKDIVPQIPSENIFGEPIGRDTAAACALGTALAMRKNKDAVCCVLTADHIIKPVSKFRNTLKQSFVIASKENAIVTIGITPDYASTGYGYIKICNNLRQIKGINFADANKFVEKPNINKAKEYIADGNYLWNSGMFIWSAKTFINEINKFAPDLNRIFLSVEEKQNIRSIKMAINKIYPTLDKISIDYAIMEKSSNIITAISDFEWDDVGSWLSLPKYFKNDQNHNTILGDAVYIDSLENIVVSEKRLTALIGVKNLVVIHTQNATLICNKNNVQRVKEITSLLAKSDKYTDII